MKKTMIIYLIGNIPAATELMRYRKKKTYVLMARLQSCDTMPLVHGKEDKLVCIMNKAIASNDIGSDSIVFNDGRIAVKMGTFRCRALPQDRR